MFDQLNEVQLHNLTVKLRSGFNKLHMHSNTLSAYDTRTELRTLVKLAETETSFRTFITITNGI
jgi:hypothetical protein